MACYVLLEVAPNKYLYYYRKYGGEFIYTGEDLLHMAEISGSISNCFGSPAWLCMAKLIACHPAFVEVPDGKIEQPVKGIYIVSTIRRDGGNAYRPEVFCWSEDDCESKTDDDLIQAANKSLMNKKESFQHWCFEPIDFDSDYLTFGD